MKMTVEEVLEAIQKKLDSLDKRISGLEAQPSDKGEKLAKKLSIREFLLSKKPKNDVDITLVVGYYLENYQSYTSFNITDIEAGFRSSKETPPDNVNDKINKNIHKGFLMDAEEKKGGKQAWVLTNLGIQYIENDLKIPK